MADRSTDEKSTTQDKKNRRFPCTFEDCTAVFKKNAHLIRHLLIHNDERPHECSFPGCGKAFRSPFHLKRHEVTHNDGKKFTCEYDGCDVACQTLWNLKRHVKRTHCGLFKCKTCHKEFKKNKLLQQHMDIEHNTCCQFPGCGAVFPVPSKLRHHMKVHTQKGYKCSVKGCSMTFQLWSACRQHSAQCKNKEQSCEICGKVFTERHNLKQHMKVHFENREVFQCTYDGCGRFYTKQSNLKVHIQSFHQNIRPFVCPKAYCNKSFHFQHLLRRHLDLHKKNSDDDNEMKASEPKKKRRPSRMVPTAAESLTGYIPSLWKKMTPEEIRDYVEQGESSSFYAETDVITHDGDDNENDEGETTQMELTHISSGDLTISKNHDDGMLHNEEDVSEETLTAFTDIDLSEEGEVILQPMKSIEEACSFLENNLHPQHSNTTSSTPSSTQTSAPVSADSADDEENKFVKWGEKLKSIVSVKRQAMNVSPTVMDSCHMQTITESDSSDSETKQKVQMLMQQCAS